MEARPGSVTLVVVAYNHSRFVEQCLDSAFAQTHPDLRTVVFDDASPDDTADVIRSHLARTGHEDVTFVAHERNRGLCATLNEALELVDTEYVAILSADDWMEPERFEVQVAELARLGPGYALIYGDAKRADEDGVDLGVTYYERYRSTVNPAYEPPEGEIFVTEITEPANATPTVMFRTACLREVGPYDETLQFEDTDMLLRLARRWKVAYLPTPLVTRRVVAGSLLATIYSDLPRFRRDQHRLLTKHLGASPEVDAIIARRLGGYAKASYMAGEPAAEVVDDLTLAFRRHRSPQNLLYLAAARSRVPGRALAGAVGAVRRLKVRVSGRSAVSG